MQVESLLEKEDNIKKESNVEEKYDDVDEPLKKKQNQLQVILNNCQKRKSKNINSTLNKQFNKVE